ncbi:MAG: metallophosphoesterase [Paludibacteraceae bacterium]|nr:metallophosphoesterase [Paludibacteraceae bacterium]
MRKGVKISLWTILLAVGIIICAIRWQVWFGMPQEPQWTDDTLSYTFPNPTEEDQDQSSLTILVLGDIHNQLKQADYDSLACHAPQADVVAQVGDWLDRGQEYYRQLLLRDWMSSQLYGKPVIACPGNHEYSKGLKKRLSATWKTTFSHPVNGPSVPGATYYIDFPGLRYIVIDTNPLDRLVYLTRTVTWLNSVMSKADGRYTVVMMHHPVFPACKGRFCPLIYVAFRYALGRADLVISGHDHSYLRRRPFVVLNTAGKTKPQKPLFKPEVCGSEPVYGIISLPSPSSKLQFSVYRMSDNTLMDSFYVTHD